MSFLDIVQNFILFKIYFSFNLRCNLIMSTLEYKLCCNKLNYCRWMAMFIKFEEGYVILKYYSSLFVKFEKG